MSAIILSENHIQYILTASREYRVVMSGGLLTQLGRMIMNKNLDAHALRYGNVDPEWGKERAAMAEAFKFYPIDPDLVFPMQVIKAIRSVIYNCALVRDMATACPSDYECLEFLREVNEAAIEHLPEYGNCVWFIE